MSERHPEGQVTIEKRGHSYLMGIDRVEKRNGITPKIVHELTAAYNELESNPELWTGVVFAHGSHFSGGIDLPMFAEDFARGANPFLNDGVDILGLQRKCMKPLVCAVQGISFTIAIELMLACDIVVAANDARFSQLEAKRGIMPAGGANVRFVERCGWGNAMYHLLTCDEFDVEEAYRLGFIQEIVEPGNQLERAIAIADAINKNAPLAIQATKRSSNLYIEKGEQVAFDDFGPSQMRLSQTEDFGEGIASFVERRAANFRGK